MADEPFVMISLKEERAKKLANVLSNKSASKILSYLANHEGATESGIAKALKLPISTVNYNMRALVEAKLVVDDEYHYSSRGREVNHYKLARKYIIIAPEDEKEGFWDRMKKFVPVVLVAAGLGVVVRILSILTGTFSTRAGATAESANLMMKSAPLAAESIPAPMAYDLVNGAGGEVARAISDDMAHEAVQDTMAAGAQAAPTLAQESAKQALDEGVRTNMTAPTVVPTGHEHSLLHTILGDWLGWFLLGIFVVVLAAMLVEYVRSRK